MEYGKYIIVSVRNCELAIMFNSIISHSIIAESFSNVISAGFFAVGADCTKNDDGDISVSCFGKSSTLKLESRQDDSIMLKKVLRHTFQF